MRVPGRLTGVRNREAEDWVLDRNGNDLRTWFTATFAEAGTAITGAACAANIVARS